VQRRIYSFIEACTNVAIGAMVALASQLVVFPWVGIHIDFQTNLWIMFWFTLISVARSYLVRRGFNWVHANTRWR
jgi:hypothetical protein